MVAVAMRPATALPGIPGPRRLMASWLIPSS